VWLGRCTPSPPPINSTPLSITFKCSALINCPPSAAPGPDKWDAMKPRACHIPSIVKLTDRLIVGDKTIFIHLSPKLLFITVHYLVFDADVEDTLAAPSPPLGSIPVSVPVIPLSYCKVGTLQQPREFVSSAVPFHLSACPSISSCNLNRF
jgi:hypothetical protein